MKLKRLMAIIGGLAVVSWLAVPAIRIWREPGLRQHLHVLQSPDGRAVTMIVGNAEVSAAAITLDHSSTFWKSYSAALLGRPSHHDECPEWLSFRRNVQDPDSEMGGPSDGLPVIQRKISGKAITIKK